MSRDTEKMAKVTRKLAREDDPEDGTPEGSHDFPSRDAQDDDYEHQHQQGVGQSDDVSGKAPASGMSRQRTNPSRG